MSSYGFGRVLTPFLCAAFVCVCLAEEIAIGVPDGALPITDIVSSKAAYDTEFKIIPIAPYVNKTDYEKLQSVYNKIQYTHVKAIIGPHDAVISMAAEQAGIPYLSTASAHPVKRACVYNMLPAACDVAMVVQDLVKAYAWKTMAVFYQGNFGDKAAEFDYLGLAVCEKLQQNPTSVMTSFWKIPEHPDAEDVRNNLRHIRSMSIHQIVLIASRNYSEIILKQARRLHMVAKPYSWILLNLGSEDIGYYVFDDLEANVTSISFVWAGKFKPYSTSYANLDLAVTRDSFSLLDKTAATLMRKNEIIDGKNLRSQLYQVTLQGETGYIWFNKSGNRANMTFDIMTFQANNVEKIGIWDSRRKESIGRIIFQDQGLNSSAPESVSLSGRLVKVVTILEKPFTMLRKGQEDLTGNDRYEGFAVDLIEHISKLLNFKYELYEVHDGNFGAKDPETGEWNGIVGEIMANNATMSVAPLSMNAEREHAIDFTKPFKTRGITLLLKKPQVQTSYFQFMSPLSMPVWICILVSIAVTSLTIFGLEHFSQKYRFDMPRFDIRESCWFVFGGLVQGSTESTPVTVPGRIVTSAWWFFSLILISTYTANLAAFLTVKKISSPITTVTDLAEQTKVKYGTVRNSGIMHFFQNTQIETFQKMWTQMSQFMTEFNVNSTAQGIELVKKGNYAFLWDSTVVSYTASEDCDVMEIGPPFDHKGFGIAVPDGATYRDTLSMAILRLADQGIITELEHKWWGLSACPDVTKSTAEDTEELHIENVAGIFFILIGGIVIAVVVSYLERWYKKRREKSELPDGEEMKENHNDHTFEGVNSRTPV